MSDTTPVIDTPSYEDIASALASQGVRTDSQLDQVIPEATIKPAAEPLATPETGKPAPEPAAGTPPAKTPEPTPAAPVQQTPAATPVKVDWREEAKKADPSELMTLLGFDDKLKGFVNKWKAGEDVTPYVEATSIDYSKMPAEEVMRRHLREEFKDLSEEDFQLVYENRITNKYQLDPELFDERQQKVGKVLLNADANKIRTQLTTAQQQMILNTKPPVPSGPTPEQQAEQAQQTRNWFKGEVQKDPLAAGILANKKLTIGEGAEAFHYEIKDPNVLFDTISDQKKMMEKVFDVRMENGEERFYPKGDRHILMGMIAEYGMDFLNQFGKHMRALGAGQALEPIENSSKESGTPANSGQPELSPAAALAMHGKIVT
jgi:hypothetical protein